MNIGTKVAVNIKNVNSWSQGAVLRLQGQVGTVTEVKTLHYNGKTHATTSPRYLVQFEPALPPIYSNGSPVSGFWFEASELDVL